MTSNIRGEPSTIPWVSEVEKHDRKDLIAKFFEISTKLTGLPGLKAFNIKYVSPRSCDRVAFLKKVTEIVTKVMNHTVSSCYDHGNEIVENCPKAIRRGRKACWHFNCYGFISKCLKMVSREPYTELVFHMEALKRAVPRSFDGIPCPQNLAAIFEQVSELKHWKCVLDVTQAKPGDIIVYLPLDYDPVKVVDVEKTPTGTHVVVVVKNKGCIGNDFCHFLVIDCTRKYHSQKDTRFPDRDGIGKASLFISPISEGRFKIKWDLHSGSEYEKKVVVGRLQSSSASSSITTSSKTFENI